MIKICNLRNGFGAQAYDVRVDRSSVLGNPFYMHNENERELVCQKYKVYFYKKIKDKDKVFIDELKRLIALYRTYGVLNLYCWCYPKQCHSEIIRDFIYRYTYLKGGDK